MENSEKGIEVKVDLYTRFCLTAIAALLTLLVIGLWAEAVPTANQASAEPARVFGDSAAQRDEVAKLQAQTVEKLKELIDLLKSGEVKVQMVQPDQKLPGGENVTPQPEQ